MEDNKQKLLAQLKALEHDYQRLTVPATMLAFKASVLDDVFDIVGGVQMVRQEASANFLVGRISQAMKPYAEAVLNLKKYEHVESKLAEIAKAEDETKKAGV